jgi:sugar phosphate isomerase/epimerase
MAKFDLGPMGRREFLIRTAGGLGAAMAAASRGAQAEPAAPSARRPWRMRLSGSSINFMRLPIEEAARRIAQLGFEAIDVWSAHAGCPHLDDVLGRLGPDGLKKLLEETGLKLCGFSVYVGGYPKYAELLGKSGGGVAIRGSAAPCDPAELRPRMRQFVEGLKPQVELAEKYDSYLAIENHGRALLDSLDSFKAFVEINRSRRLGIALAPYHLQAIGASVEEAIRISGRQLLYFYAWQRAPGLKQLPGHGETDFAPWLAALAEVEFAGYVNPFLHDEPEPDETAAALARSIEYLKAAERRALAFG